MLPNSDEKVKESVIKKKSFSLLNDRHSYSQSSNSSVAGSNETTTIQSSFNLENNKRGWLESTSVQVTPSRSLDTRKSNNVTKPTTANIRKPAKDIGAVSDEDIFKLTELTSRLPEVTLSNKHSRRRSEYDENSTRKRNQQSDDDPVTHEKITSQQIKPGIRRPSISTPPSITAYPTRNSSEIESNERKRRSWLYKSLIKPYKTKGTSKSKDNQKISVAASIAEDFYNNNPLPINNFGLSRVNTVNNPLKKKLKPSPIHGRSNSSNMNGEPSTSNNRNRRHSFDSFQSLIKESVNEPLSKDEEDQEIYNLIENKEFIDYHDNALNEWDQERKKENPTFDYSHEERPSFHLVVSPDDNQEIDHPLEDEEDILLELKKTSSSGVNTYSSFDQSSQEKAVTFMFDYYSLPVEVKSLIDSYEHKGKAERKELIVKHKKYTSDEDDDDDLMKEEDDEDEDEEETVDYSDLITGNCTSSQKDRRDIAVVTATRSDNIEFTKLIQVSMEGPSNDGPLLDLHVSLFGENNPGFNNDINQEEFHDTIQSIEQNIERFQSFKTNSETFLNDHLDTIDSLNLYCNQALPRNLSFPSLQSASKQQLSDEPESNDGFIRRPIHESRKEKYNRNTRSMYASNKEYPFDCRQREIMSLVSNLKNELHKFKDSLEKTEDLVTNVQVDMDDTRNRMETYIKDIPESHYSTLKKLEVDIESILSNRAKNPWLDTGYALLSYLLTLFALVVWIVIYILKWGKKVILFPTKLWKAYSDYLVERNKAVKKASMMSVAGASSNSSVRINDDDLLFQRSDRVTRQATENI